jgi:catechol 2,3-dioxygenase-like lactoylglutathione lyase family enzyme
LIVERTDFVSVPVTDIGRSTAFYRDTLGLEQIGDSGFPEFQLGANVSLYLIDPTKVGGACTRLRCAGWRSSTTPTATC